MFNTVETDRVLRTTRGRQTDRDASYQLKRRSTSVSERPKVDSLSVVLSVSDLTSDLRPSLHPFTSTELSLILRSPHVTVDARWCDRKWKMNLSHQDQGELPLRGGFPPRAPPDRFDESPLPLVWGHRSRGLKETQHCSVFQRTETLRGTFHLQLGSTSSGSQM
ncbi:unnamed protein product [Pleuronectes platessa]|uniref:Uncharacterized protein n=1 Tax=Pleuronectes platessa TaxID=8262 RepID=A0A9N7ZC52_PLEPL|nr:unnamed protein product [Pleuronectes platessa]